MSNGTIYLYVMKKPNQNQIYWTNAQGCERILENTYMCYDKILAKDIYIYIIFTCTYIIYYDTILSYYIRVNFISTALIRKGNGQEN